MQENEQNYTQGFVWEKWILKTRLLVAFLMQKMDSTGNSMPEKGMT